MALLITGTVLLVIPLVAVLTVRQPLFAALASCVVGVPLLGWWEVVLQKQSGSDFDVVFELSLLLMLATLGIYYLLFAATSVGVAKLFRWLRGTR